MLHQIGAGALGPVYRAYEPDRDRLVAVKLFRLDLPPERVHQLVGEFEQLIAADLEHAVIAAPLAGGSVSFVLCALAGSGTRGCLSARQSGSIRWCAIVHIIYTPGALSGFA